MQYVVHSEPPPGEPAYDKPFKVFSNCQDACRFADVQVGEDASTVCVYEVAAVSAREAIAAVDAGKGGQPVYAKTSKSVPKRQVGPTTQSEATSEELGF